MPTVYLPLSKLQVTMLDYAAAKLEKVALHHVGNKTNGEELFLSTDLMDIEEEKIKDLLFKFFIPPFATAEFYNFTFSNGDFNLNPLFHFASQIFENHNTLQPTSIDITKHLYEVSTHPNIKPGDLFIAYFKDLGIDDQPMDAIGIFKSENRQSFLKVDNDSGEFSIKFEDGINIDKMDKGCIILNTDKENGYKVCVIDKSNKQQEAQYWKELFLQIKPCSDAYHFTKDMMAITKNFVTQQVSEEFSLTKTDQIDLLNRSVEYFKTHEQFEKSEFETEVFHHANLIESFQDFDGKYREKNGIELDDHFEINGQAVKKQAKMFKNVLKLDKNFHVYIHGNRDLIQQGVESDGRKFYKIYFENVEMQDR